MRPGAAIQPYRPDTIQHLVGIFARVPVMSRPEKNWWVKILDVLFINEHSAAVFVESSHGKFGNARWVPLNTLRWKDGLDEEPLLLAMHKVRSESRRTS